MAPRGADNEAPTLKLELPRALKLDAGPLLAAGAYELVYVGGEMIAVSLSTRQEALRLPLASKPVPTGPQIAALTIDRKTHRATVTVRLEREEVVFTGVLQGAAKQESLVGLGEAAPSSLPASQVAAQEEDDPTARMWRSRLPQLQSCIDKSTNEQFEKCACPLVLKFKFPPKSSARVFAAGGRNVGVAIDDKGRVKACAVK